MKVVLLSTTPISNQDEMDRMRLCIDYKYTQMIGTKVLFQEERQAELTKKKKQEKKNNRPEQKKNDNQRLKSLLKEQ